MFRRFRIFRNGGRFRIYGFLEFWIFRRGWGFRRLERLAEVGGAHACLALEEAAEGGEVGEAHAVADILDGEAALDAEEGLGVGDQLLMNPMADAVSRLAFDDGAEMLGREAEKVCVELDIVVLAAMLHYGVAEEGADAVSMVASLAHVLDAETANDAEHEVEHDHEHLAAVDVKRSVDDAEHLDDGEDIGILAVGQPEMGLAFENEAVVAGVDEAESAEEFLGDDEEGGAIVGGRTVDKECVHRVENRYVVRSKNEWVAVVEAFDGAAVVDAHRVVGLDKIDTVGWHTSHIVENDDAFFFDFSLHLTYKIQAVFHSGKG